MAGQEATTDAAAGAARPGRPTRAPPAVPPPPPSSSSSTTAPVADGTGSTSSSDSTAALRSTTSSLAALDMASLPASGSKPRPPIPTSSLLHPTLSTLPSLNAANADVLTPLRAHYLKKYLVNHQFMDELATLADPALDGVGGAGDAIAALGKPFVPGRDPQTGRERPLPDLPFIRFMFRQFILTFPCVYRASSSRLWSRALGFRMPGSRPLVTASQGSTFAQRSPRLPFRAGCVTSLPPQPNDNCRPDSPCLPFFHSS